MAYITVELNPDPSNTAIKITFEVSIQGAKEIIEKYANLTLAGAKTPSSLSHTDETGETPPSDPKPAGETGKGASGPQNTPPTRENNPASGALPGSAGGPKIEQPCKKRDRVKGGCSDMEGSPCLHPGPHCDHFEAQEGPKSPPGTTGPKTPTTPPLPEIGPPCPKHGGHMRLQKRAQTDGTHYYCPVPVGRDQKTGKTRFCAERM